MRLLHVADAHQGLTTHSRPDPATGLPSRVLDVGRCWHRAAEIAVERAVDVVIVAGDSFHAANPDAASLNQFAIGLRVLEVAGIPTLLLAGNHDRAPHPNQSSVLQVFAVGDLVRVVERPQVVELEGIRIACLPSVSMHQLMANRPGLARSQGVQALVDGLCSVLGDLRTQTPHVLTLHWTIEGSVLGTGRDVQIMGPGEPILPLAEVDGPWRYVAAGHIHKAQALGLGDGLIRYAGSIDRMSFGEEHERKVVVEVELPGDGHTPVVLEHELPARPFVTLTETLSPDHDVYGAIVRLRLPHELADHVDATRRAAYDAGADVVIGGAEVEQVTRARDERVTETLGLEEALEAWCDVREVDEAERPDLRQTVKELAEEVGT